MGWDAHNELIRLHTRTALQVDQPIAGLLTDLKARGLFDDTLVVWGGEFGRTPIAQAGDGRDHNPYGYTMWMSGAGVKHGYAYGATDEYGYYAVEDRMHIHDMHGLQGASVLMKAMPVAVASFAAFLGWGQTTVSRVFEFTHITREDDLQEAATVVRAIRRSHRSSLSMWEKGLWNCAAQRLRWRRQTG